MITLIAAAVEDGWAIVRHDNHYYLLNPPYGTTYVAEVPECVLREAVTVHGFSEMYVEFDQWASLIAFLQEQTRTWRQVSGRPAPPTTASSEHKEWPLTAIEQELTQIEKAIAASGAQTVYCEVLEKVMTADIVRGSIPLFSRIARLLRACRTGASPVFVERRTRERLIVSHLPGVLCELLIQGQPAVAGPILDINGGGLKVDLNRVISAFEMSLVDEARILVNHDEIACIPVRELYPAKTGARCGAVRLSVVFAQPSDQYYIPMDMLEYCSNKQFRLKDEAPVRQILESMLLGSGRYHSRRRERRVRLPLDIGLVVTGVAGDSSAQPLGTLGDISPGGMSLYATEDTWTEKPWRRYSRLRISRGGRMVGEREAAVSNERLMQARSMNYVRVGWVFPQPASHVNIDALSAQFPRTYGMLRPDDAADGEHIARAIFSQYSDIRFDWTRDKSALKEIIACRQRIFRKLLAISPTDCAGRRLSDRYDGTGAYLQVTAHGALIGAARILTEEDAPEFECEAWTGRKLRDAERPAAELAWFCIEPAYRSACAPGLEVFRRMSIEAYRYARSLNAARVLLTVHQPMVGLCEHMGFRIISPPFRIPDSHCYTVVLELELGKLLGRMHPDLAPTFLEQV